MTTVYTNQGEVSKFGMEEYTMGLLSHAKFGPGWKMEVGTVSPKFKDLVKIVVFLWFLPQEIVWQERAHHTTCRIFPMGGEGVKEPPKFKNSDILDILPV